ncbi:MAG: NADH-quinone oxidoreductase subunit G [Planctomycetota bacterium]
MTAPASDGGGANLVEFELDGVTRQVPEGTSVLEAAALFGVEIPHFCYHPGLGVDGNCRLCLVEIEGARGLQISCNTTVSPGMVVRAMSEEAKGARRDTLEFILLNHPIDCPICDQAGECKLQDYYAVLGPYDSRFSFEKVRKGKAVELGAGVVLDQERCVLCARCTRFMADVAGEEQLVIANRGNHSEITTFPGQPLDSEYAGNVVDVCPVGALTSQHHRFKTRAWMLARTKTVCTGCATGCSIWADHKDDVVYRFRPRANPHVNGWWICDTGRRSHRTVNEDRVLFAQVRRGPERRDAERAEAIGAAAAALKTARDHGKTIAVLGSPECTNEELWVLKELAAKVLGTPHVTGTSLKPTGEADGVLRHAILHPNTPGVLLVGLTPGSGGQDIPELYDTAPDCWLILNADPVGEADDATGARAKAALEAAGDVIVLATHASATTDLATVLLPGSVALEQDGTMVAANGRLQRVRRAVAAKGDAQPDSKTLLEIGRAVGAREGEEWTIEPAASARTLFKSLQRDVPALAAIRWESLGDEGVAIDAPGAGGTA